MSQSTAITLSQLEQYLSKAAWILKGPVDASDFKVYIFPLLFFKRISDVYQDEYQKAFIESDGDHEYASLPEFHSFNIPKGSNWQSVRETSSNVGVKIEDSFRQIEQANQTTLYNIFGDAQWSNKEKLSDALLINLIEHFSQYNLSNKYVEVDILGQAYEYLIKHFADLTNKKAGEFYTPRPVVHLLGRILNPQEGESIYDPACGTGGMLLECIYDLQKTGKDHRTLELYGQEKNLTSSSIAKMNMFLHGIEDFQIKRGDTLRNPAFFESDGLKTFDCVIANPPFSLKDWGYEAWEDDPFGRNIFGTPPKSNGDMAWVQHMIKSMSINGRMGIVLPHGVLFRKGSEGKIRKQLIDHDLIESIIGLGSNIFYGTSIAPCVLIIKNNKTLNKKNKLLFIDASNQHRVGKNQCYLEPHHVMQIYEWYNKYENVENCSAVVDINDIKQNNYNLNIPLYIDKVSEDDTPSVKESLTELKTYWDLRNKNLHKFDKLFQDFVS
jgi:type I restriction enzyme M protein